MPIFQALFQDLLGSILLFPFWWYGTGFQKLLIWMKNDLSYRWRSYAIGLWAKSILVPMYGQYDWAGRIISFLMRSAVIIGRSIAFLFEILMNLFLVFLWVLAPAGFLIAFAYSFIIGTAI